jgi:hypothetical protein
MKIKRLVFIKVKCLWAKSNRTKWPWSKNSETMRQNKSFSVNKCSKVVFPQQVKGGWHRDFNCWTQDNDVAWVRNKREWRCTKRIPQVWGPSEYINQGRRDFPRLQGLNIARAPMHRDLPAWLHVLDHVKDYTADRRAQPLSSGWVQCLNWIVVM